MDKRSQALYSDTIFQEALARFGIARETTCLLDGFESFIYACERDGQASILRISHNLHHPPNRTRGEMDFLAYLSARGLSVPRPQPSLAGNLVEVIAAPSPDLPDGSYFSAALFDKAPGRPPAKADWTPELFEAMGRFLGRLHTFSKQYQPSQPEFRRHEWYEDEQDYAARYLPASERVIIDKFASLVAHLKALPRDPHGYGLVHQDFHAGNFFIHPAGGDPHITLFDFDDCSYAPYVYDIAMALFYAVPHHCDSPSDLAFARLFYQTFMQGYRQENTLDPAWMKEIPAFLKLREMDLYIIIHRSFDLDQLGAWEASFMKGRKERLENDVPFIDLDFD